MFKKQKQKQKLKILIDQEMTLGNQLPEITTTLNMVITIY